MNTDWLRSLCGGQSAVSVCQAPHFVDLDGVPWIVVSDGTALLTACGVFADATLAPDADKFKRFLLAPAVVAPVGPTVHLDRLREWCGASEPWEMCPKC